MALIALSLSTPAAAMNDAWVCHANVKRLRRLLANADEGPERTLLTKLLSEEEAKLARLSSSARAPTGGNAIASHSPDTPTPWRQT